MGKCAILIAILMMGCCAYAQQPTSDPLAQGIALLQKGDFQHSLLVLRHAVELNPGSAPAHNYYGFALARNGSVDQAIRYVERLIASGADEILFLVQMGTVPHEATMETIRNIGEHLIPHFRNKMAAAAE